MFPLRIHCLLPSLIASRVALASDESGRVRVINNVGDVRSGNTPGVKPRLHQQQCWSNIKRRMLQVERFFRQSRILLNLLRHCWGMWPFFGNIVERNFVLSTKSKQVYQVYLTLYSLHHQLTVLKGNFVKLILTDF